MVLKKADHHWAFLDEIEAPMWVDLTVEAKFNKQDNSDDWFHISHPFHQRSSDHLKSAFSDEGIISLDLDLQGSDLPKLPPSVSGSRGKHYRSNKWKAEKLDFALNNKQHPIKGLSGKSFFLVPQCGGEIKPKSGFMNFKGTSWSKTSFTGGSSLTGNAIPICSKPVSTYGNPASKSSSMENKTCERSVTSTVTSQSSQQQEPVTTLQFGPIGLLPKQRSSLRKSYTTKEAPKVEMNNNKRPSRGRKSSSSKSCVSSSSGNSSVGFSSGNSSVGSSSGNSSVGFSSGNSSVGSSSGNSSVGFSSGNSSVGFSSGNSSVGSSSGNSSVGFSSGNSSVGSSSGNSSVGSSSNPCNVKSSTSRPPCQKETTREGGDVVRMAHAARNKINVSRAATDKIEDVSSRSRMRTKTNVLKSVYKEAAKPKNLRAKALVPVKVNEQDSSTAVLKSKEKLRAGGRSRRLVGTGKENARAAVARDQKCRGKGIPAVPVARDQKETKQSLRRKCGAGLADSQGKVSDRHKENRSAKVRQNL